MKNQKGPFLVRIQLINATAKCMIGSWPPGEEFGPYPDLCSLYWKMKSAWGGRVSSVYIDTDDGPRRIGWVFKKVDRYRGGKETYVREAWVEVVREIEPEKPAKYELVSLG